MYTVLFVSHAHLPSLQTSDQEKFKKTLYAHYRFPRSQEQFGACEMRRLNQMLHLLIQSDSNRYLNGRMLNSASKTSVKSRISHAPDWLIQFRACEIRGLNQAYALLKSIIILAVGNTNPILSRS